MASGPIISWQTEGEKMEAVTDFIFWPPKSLQMGTTALSNSMKLSHAHGAMQDGRVMVERPDRMWLVL